LNLRPPD